MSTTTTTTLTIKDRLCREIGEAMQLSAFTANVEHMTPPESPFECYRVHVEWYRCGKHYGMRYDVDAEHYCKAGSRCIDGLVSRFKGKVAMNLKRCKEKA